MEVGVECCCFLDHELLRGVEGFFLIFGFDIDFGRGG